MKDYILPIGITLVILFIVYKIMQSVGLVDTREDKRGKRALSSNAFDTKLYKEVENGTPNPKYRNGAADFAKQIYEAKGYLYDQDGSAINVFRQMNSKAQVSFLADVFSKIYKRDLAQYLNFMSDESRSQLADLVNALPRK